jgi:hypothetical protein
MGFILSLQLFTEHFSFKYILGELRGRCTQVESVYLQVKWSLIVSDLNTNLNQLGNSAECSNIKFNQNRFIYIYFIYKYIKIYEIFNILSCFYGRE